MDREPTYYWRVSPVESNRVTVETSRIINAPVDRLWAEVANFNNVASWHSDVTESQLQDESGGATGFKPGEIRVIKLR
jgi:polyketide cyclase/dehydrase/lipid transport protein